MTYIIHGVFPPRPTEGDGGSRFCNATWALCEQCWAASPENRPSITDVLVLLEGLRKIRYAPASLNPLAKEFKITLTHAPSSASPPLNALAAPFSPRSPIVPTQLTTKAFPSTLNSQAAVFIPRERPATGATPPRATRPLDPHAVPFVPRSTPVPAIRADEEILESPAQRSRSPAQVASICTSSPSAEHPRLVSPASTPPSRSDDIFPEDLSMKRPHSPEKAATSSSSQSQVPTSPATFVAPPTHPKLNHNAPAFVPRLPPAQLNRNAPIFVPRRAVPPPLLCTSLAPSPPPLVDSPRTPDLVPDLPSSAPPTPSTAHPTPTRGDSAVFNLDAKPFVPGQRLRSATTPNPAQDDSKQETIRATAYALLF